MKRRAKEKEVLTKAFKGNGQELEAAVHTSLPPQVDGALKGHVCVRMKGPVQWECSVRPPAPRLSVKLKWWGEKTSGTLFRVSVVTKESSSPNRTFSTTTCAYYPVRSGLTQFTAYLKDMGRLVFEVGLGNMTESSMVIGTATVGNLVALTTEGLIEGSYPILSFGDVFLGQLHVLFQLNMKDKKDKGKVHKDENPKGKVALPMPMKEAVAMEIRKDGAQQQSNVERRNMLIGKRQMEVISELYERGIRLRDKMADSLTTSNQKTDGGKEPFASSKMLALMSAEVAALDQNRGGGTIKASQLYTELSSDESLSNISMEASLDSPVPHSSLTSKTDSLTIQTHDTLASRAGVLHETPKLDHNENFPAPSKDEADSAGSSDKKEVVHSEGLAALPSVFGSCVHGSLESDILNAVGLEQLTRLARATSVRIVVTTLDLDLTAVDKIINRIHAKQVRISRKLSQSTPKISSSLSGMYFVEYQFPAALLHMKASSHRHTHLHEVIRITCKKMKDGKVVFNHRSVFPMCFSSEGLLNWWKSDLIFRVYCRPQNQRMPFLVGKAVVHLKDWLISPSVHAETSLQVHSSSLAKALHTHSTTDPCIGHLQISMVMMVGKKVLFSELNVGSPVKESSTRRQEEDLPVQNLPPRETTTQSHQPIKLRERSPTSCDFSRSEQLALQLLLMIPEGVDIGFNPPPSSDSLSSSSSLGVAPLPACPNCYLTCKLFCAQPHPRTQVEWSTPNPQFLFRQLFPLFLTPALMDKLANNFSVVEVWHRTPGGTTDDQLVGLVKLSLHQFYLSFAESSSASLCTQTELPVIAVDCYCPIVEPITGQTTGRLAVVLALGTPDQVSRLLKQHAAGSFPLQQPYQTQRRGDDSSKRGKMERSVEPHLLQTSAKGNECLVHHKFKVQVEGVKGLEVAKNTVWGEADCFVQYHFPTESHHSHPTQPEIDLHPYCTLTTLYMPNPTFCHETTHFFSLESSRPIGQELAKACGGSHGLSGEIPFELWKRFYYPNIRDQLMAKASLPLVKLCALAGMHSSFTTSTICSQTFPLPLKPLSKGEAAGILEVTIGYSSFTDTPAEGNAEGGTLVNLSLGILRMAGLKRAAVLAAQQHPLPLDFAAEVGVNAYAKIRTARILPESPTTKTVARNFAPDLSHMFEISVALAGTGEKKWTHGLMATELLLASLLVEVWHQVPKKASPCTSSHGSVVGRRLAPSFQDVLLGVARVPLERLVTHTGVRGWYPLLPPGAGSEPPVFGPSPEQQQQPPAVSCMYVGGVEVSAGFCSKKDRQLVLSLAEQCGWQSSDWTQQEGRGQCWKVEMQALGLWLQMKTLFAITATEREHMLCFVKYRFFDLEPVASIPRSASLSPDQQDRIYYQLQHKAFLFIPASPQLEWYVSEENLEVQVWGSTTSHSTRPAAGDLFIGSVYIPLSDLTTSERCVSGWYPIFKAGAEDLGQQALYLQLSISPSSEEREATVMVLDSVARETETPAPVIKSIDKEESHHEEIVNKLEDVAFEARIVIHEALHLPILTDPDQKRERLPNPYVSLHPHPSVEKVMSPAVEACCKPLWNHQCITHIPNLHLQPQSPGLELQVWSSEKQCKDHYIGSIQVDLSPLSFGLAQLSGWYHILDFAGEVQGQLKVSVVPTQRKSFPSPLLCPCCPSQASIESLPLRGEYCPPPPTSSTSTSILFQRLRENIQDLDQIHQSLQAKLKAEEEQLPQNVHQSSQHEQTANTQLTDDVKTNTTLPEAAELGHHFETTSTRLLKCVETNGVSEPSRLDQHEGTGEIEQAGSHVYIILEDKKNGFHQSPLYCDSNSNSSEHEGSSSTAASCSTLLSQSSTSTAQALTEVNQKGGTGVLESGRLSPLTASPETSCDSSHHPTASHLYNVSEDTCPQQPMSQNTCSQQHKSDNHPQQSDSEGDHKQQDVSQGDSHKLDLFEDDSQQHDIAENNAQQGKPSVDNHQQCGLIGIEGLPSMRGSVFPPMEPCLPNFFMSPQRLEQSLRTIRASALARPPPPNPTTCTEGRIHQDTEKAGDEPARRRRTPAETERIAKIFSSKQ